MSPSIPVGSKRLELGFPAGSVTLVLEGKARRWRRAKVKWEKRAALI